MAFFEHFEFCISFIICFENKWTISMCAHYQLKSSIVSITQFVMLNLVSVILKD